MGVVFKVWKKGISSYGWCKVEWLSVKMRDWVSWIVSVVPSDNVSKHLLSRGCLKDYFAESKSCDYLIKYYTRKGCWCWSGGGRLVLSYGALLGPWDTRCAAVVCKVLNVMGCFIAGLVHSVNPRMDRERKADIFVFYSQLLKILVSSIYMTWIPWAPSLNFRMYLKSSTVFLPYSAPIFIVRSCSLVHWCSITNTSIGTDFRFIQCVLIASSGVRRINFQWRS
jgi:hypothetical protein